MTLAARTIVTIAMLSAGAVAAEDQAIGPALQQSMIWLDSAPFGKEVYAAFRKQLPLAAAPKKAMLHIFADTRYMLWINGHYVERGPCRFVPSHPEYDTLDVTSYLRQGDNVLAVVVHHFHDGVMKDTGSEVNGRVARHVPGLTAVLDITDRDGRHTKLSTDITWRGSTKTQFGPSGISKGFIVDKIDARREPRGWMLAGFDDSSWERPVSIDGRQWGRLGARTIPLLRETEVKSLMLIERAGKPVHRPLAEALPIDLKSGDQLVIDTVQFVLAYSVLDIEAEAGSELELEYAPTYAATRRRSTDQKKNASHYMDLSTNRYIARAGRQTYMSNDSAGCKYLVIRLKSGRARLLGLRMINRLYPFEVVGRFQSNDALLNHLWQLGINTTCLCSEDAYVDSSTRERASWLGDGTIVEAPITRVALAGPGKDGKPWYADPRLLRQKVWQVGHCVLPDGRVKAFAPSDGFDKHGYIEDYACLWIQGIRSYYDVTGDLETVRGLWPAVTGQLKWFLDRRSPRGLVNAREFVTWGNPLIYKVCEGATLNAYIYQSLLDAAELARRLEKPRQQREYEAAAGALKSAINEHLWNDKVGTYYGAILDGKKTPPTAYAAVLCLYFDVVPPERRDRVNQWLLANCEKEDFYTYGCAFLFEVLYRMDTAVADQLVLDKIRRRWANIAKSETGTVWAEDVGEVCCHIYGATPTYYLSRHVLGVGVDGPVRHRRIVIDPRLGDLHRVEGTVVTDFGPVPVLWEKTDDGKKFAFQVEIPDRVTANLRLPRIGETSAVVLDGQPIKPVERGRSLEVELGSGKHHGVVLPGVSVRSEDAGKVSTRRTKPAA
jgi:alpha-L-rhamnosidase